jgi:hypothetical protein
MEKIKGVYKIENKINGKRYIGSSVDTKRRWKEHKTLLNNKKHHSYKLQRDWESFGEDSFIFELIQEVSDISMIKEFEQKWMDAEESYVFGYNISREADKLKNVSDSVRWGNDNGGFSFFMFQYGVDRFLDTDMTNQDIFKLFYISSFIKKDNYLAIGKTYMKRKQLKEALGMGKSCFHTLFRKLQRLDYIRENDTNKHIQINPSVFFKGYLEKKQTRYSDFTRIYIDTIRFMYNNTVITDHCRLGGLLRLIPYLNKDTNLIYRNPSDLNSLIKLNYSDIATICDYSKTTIPKTLTRVCKCLLQDYSPVARKVKESDSKLIINPRLVYGGNFEDDESKSVFLKYFNLNF